jgi:DNA-binding transcriptional ArsR family regulator
MTIIDYDDSNKSSDNYDNNDNNFRFADKSSMLSVRQQIIMECMLTQRTTSQTLKILEENGYKITDRTLRREKSIIREKNLKKLYQLAKTDFHDQHIQRIQKLMYIEREMLNNYEQITDHYKKNLALERIANLQPILSAYDDTARYVLEKMYPAINDYYDKNKSRNNHNNNMITE